MGGSGLAGDTDTVGSGLLKADDDGGSLLVRKSFISSIPRGLGSFVMEL